MTSDPSAVIDTFTSQEFDHVYLYLYGDRHNFCVSNLIRHAYGAVQDLGSPSRPVADGANTVEDASAIRTEHAAEQVQTELDNLLDLFHPVLNAVV